MFFGAAKGTSLPGFSPRVCLAQLLLLLTIRVSQHIFKIIYTKQSIIFGETIVELLVLDCRAGKQFNIWREVERFSFKSIFTTRNTRIEEEKSHATFTPKNCRDLTSFDLISLVFLARTGRPKIRVKDSIFCTRRKHA